VLAGASNMSALLAAHRVFSFDGEGGITVVAESSHPSTNLADPPATAQAG
jgi:hypothetical protein